jgi:hypothetical protein
MWLLLGTGAGSALTGLIVGVIDALASRGRDRRQREEALEILRLGRETQHQMVAMLTEIKHRVYLNEEPEK